MRMRVYLIVHAARICTLLVMSGAISSKQPCCGFSMHA